TILIAGYPLWYPFDHLDMLNNAQQAGYHLIETAIFTTPRELPDLTPENAKDFIYRGLPLIDMAAYEICTLLELGHPFDIDPDDPEHWDVIESSLKRMAGLIDYYHLHFDFYKPSLVTYPQGYVPAAIAMRVVAMLHNTPTLVIEHICDRDRLMCETKTGVSVNYNSVAETFKEKLDTIDQAEADNFWEHFYDSIKTRKHAEHQSPTQELVIQKERPDQKIMTFLGQVGTDSSVLFGSIYFHSQAGLIIEAAKQILDAGHYVVVKLHPKESTKAGRPIDNKPYNKLTYRKLQEHPDFAELSKNPRLIIDSDNLYDSYSTILVADACMTINSQIGLEAACMGKPVIVCGKCTYGESGFTNDVHNETELKEALQKVLSSTLQTDPARARKFFYSYTHYSAIEKELDNFIHLMLDMASQESLAA
ncbi:MAG TPA: hypothetical protein VGF14_05570, partial [Alphaproteobacteria bacterium]